MRLSRLSSVIICLHSVLDMRIVCIHTQYMIHLIYIYSHIYIIFETCTDRIFPTRQNGCVVNSTGVGCETFAGIPVATSLDSPRQKEKISNSTRVFHSVVKQNALKTTGVSYP